MPLLSGEMHRMPLPAWWTRFWLPRANHCRKVQRTKPNFGRGHTGLSTRNGAVWRSLRTVATTAAETLKSRIWNPSVSGPHWTHRGSMAAPHGLDIAGSGAGCEPGSRQMKPRTGWTGKGRWRWTLSTSCIRFHDLRQANGTFSRAEVLMSASDQHQRNGNCAPDGPAGSSGKPKLPA